MATRTRRRRPDTRRVERRKGPMDRLVIWAMIAIPTILVVVAGLAPRRWARCTCRSRSGTASASSSGIEWVGTKNYKDIATIYPPFWPAIQHNVIWFGLPLRAAHDARDPARRAPRPGDVGQPVLPDGVLPARWCCPWPSSASSGSSSTRTDQGLINQVFDSNVDWYGDPNVNLWAVLVATAWRHTGYIMLIYLAGLKGVDSTLREAAAVDGASETKTFFQVIFPVMRPINLIVLVDRRHRVAAGVRPRVGHQQGSQRSRADLGAGVAERHRRGHPLSGSGRRWRSS